MIRAAAVAVLASVSIAACAETTERSADAAPAASTDTSAQSPMTVNPGPPTGKAQSMPSTPPTLPEDPAQTSDDKSMPPGPVNPGPGGA